MTNKENRKPGNGSPNSQSNTAITPPSGELKGEGHRPEAWQIYHIAEYWFQDAKNEADKEKDIHNIRREIIFAVCFAESYLVEWLRDFVLKSKQWKDIRTFFPEKNNKDSKHLGIKERWKDVMKKLFISELFDLNKQDFNNSTWQQFTKLVDFRDGLVHGVSSLPQTGRLPGEEEENPFPTETELMSLQNGWATKVVVDLVHSLHEATQTPLPKYLKHD